MKNNFSFREPLNEESDGTYITIGQMQFFLNRRDGKRKFKSGSEDFMEYYNMCRVYNLISEIMEEDETAAIMYWDPKQEIVSVGFPDAGAVSNALAYIESIDDIDIDF